MLVGKREGAKLRALDRRVPELVVARNVAAALRRARGGPAAAAAALAAGDAPLVRDSCALLARLLADDDLSIMVRALLRSGGGECEGGRPIGWGGGGKARGLQWRRWPPYRGAERTFSRGDSHRQSGLAKLPMSDWTLKNV